MSYSDMTPERFAKILTDLLVLLWIGFRTDEWDIAFIGLGVQAVGFVVWKLFSDRKANTDGAEAS